MDNEEREALLYSEEELAARLQSERALWEEAAERNRSGVHDAAYAEGEAAATARLESEINALRESLVRAETEAKRRESEVRCMRALRARELDEGLSVMLLSPGEAELDDEEIDARVDRLSKAVEQAALRTLQSRAVGTRPTAGEETPITPRLLRDIPLSQLAALMRE